MFTHGQRQPPTQESPSRLLRKTPFRSPSQVCRLTQRPRGRRGGSGVPTVRPPPRLRPPHLSQPTKEWPCSTRSVLALTLALLASGARRFFRVGPCWYWTVSGSVRGLHPLRPPRCDSQPARPPEDRMGARLLALPGTVETLCLEPQRSGLTRAICPHLSPSDRRVPPQPL
jgi:hypothetical protein